MPRTPHPADVYNADIIARAIEWSAFTQGGGRIVRHVATRDERGAEIVRQVRPASAVA